MDLKVCVKSEPVDLEETENYELIPEITHLKEEFKSELMELEGAQENYELVPEITHLKEEFKSEMAELGQTQPFAEVKNEIIIEEHTNIQMVSCFEEDNIVGCLEEISNSSTF
ncbi:uncharacterized protein [Anabrus simplex]|uniref:uncharacterized protein isoform X3 n=1 Tax=Anabrus simplex TaxID=316456 RepID=UPI0035A31007